MRKGDKGENRIYGVNPVLEALRSGSRHIDKIYLARGGKDKEIEEIIRLAKSQGVGLRFEPRGLITNISGTDKHQGVFGIVGARRYALLEELLAIPKKKGEKGFFLILDGIEDPRNLGAIIRSAEGAGVHGIIIPERRSVGITDLVSKASAGAIEYMPVARVVNIVRAIDLLKENGLWVLGLDAKGKASYLDLDYKMPIAAVIGNEGSGIRRLTLKRCDELISIPLKGRVSSLNISVAASVFAYEVLRQRGRERRGERNIGES